MTIQQIAYGFFEFKFILRCEGNIKKLFNINIKYLLM